jgi:hypothetical protein
MPDMQLPAKRHSVQAKNSFYPCSHFDIIPCLQHMNRPGTQPHVLQLG